jgi:hypothetical protein
VLVINAPMTALTRALSFHHEFDKGFGGVRRPLLS